MLIEPEEELRKPIPRAGSYESSFLVPLSLKPSLIQVVEGSLQENLRRVLGCKRRETALSSAVEQVVREAVSVQHGAWPLTWKADVATL